MVLNIISTKTQNVIVAQLLSHVQVFVTPRAVHGIVQARIVGWVAVPFSSGSSQPRDQTQVSACTECRLGEKLRRKVQTDIR